MKKNKLQDSVYKEFYIKDSNKRNIKALPFKDTAIKNFIKDKTGMVCPLCYNILDRR